MVVLVCNAGSSSLKADLLDPASGARLRSLRVERIGSEGCFARWDGGEPVALGRVDATAAMGRTLPELAAGAPGGAVTIVGHRVVHGGERFVAATVIDDAVEAEIEALSPLAPLHNPANLAGIRAARALLPDALHVAIFDTAFHATLPRRARSYALPSELSERLGLRRYGFHGTSHGWVAEAAARALQADLRDLRIITCHLGNGASLAAVEFGRSIDTTMGMTPLEGLAMGTRSGDVDPGILIDLLRRGEFDVDGLERMLNRESGLAGLSGVGNDVRDIEAAAAAGDDRCQHALAVYCHRIRRGIGSMAASLGGVDAIVFCAGVGENAAAVRQRVAAGLGYLGAHLDAERNATAKVDRASQNVARISADHSRVQLLVVATDEEHAIARAAVAVARMQERTRAVPTPPPIPIAVSARHIHLTRDAVEALFGPGATLTPLRPLSQPGQFACKETLTIVGPRRSIEGVRILGPERRDCQVEISRTDEFHLGIDAPVRSSGDVAGSPGVTLIGPAGSLTLTEGVICARRHIHMHPDDATRFAVHDGDVVDVAIDSEGRDLVFGDVQVRVSSKFQLEMHIDTDEANAAQLEPGVAGQLRTLLPTGDDPESPYEATTAGAQLRVRRNQS